ncbi:MULTISPECIES: hypothetical protein [Streptacidiphilus]|uniref:Uncharacterized protein n=1 Tax=Streptacidiphilus cavernicola TaxID=3342716 RepID=A0ABV6V159_9ACTN|nr:hypothetical protein [Streptacidiphilus jeojiense]
MNTLQSAEAVQAKLPPWLWGNDILGFAHTAQLKITPVDVDKQRWSVQALERHEHRTARLVRLIEIAPPGGGPQWERLRRLPASRVPNTVSPELVAHKRHELVESTSPENLLARLNWLHMSLTLARDEEFISAADSAFQSLKSVQTDEAKPLFPDLAAYFVSFDPAVSWRSGLARVLLRIEEEPALLATPPTPTGQLAFGSGTMLQTDIQVTRDAYLAPLFLCHSPYLWSIVGPRQQGVTVLSLGKPLGGQTPDPAELIQQFMPSGPSNFPACPPIAATQISSTLAWWADHLNELLSVATDPATFRDAAGAYRPRRQFETLLSLEQAGKRVQAVLAHQRDPASRRLLAFAALDTLEGLKVVSSLENAFELTKAERVLHALEGALPAEVAAVLLPSARRAVEALRECQNGFLPSSHVSGGGVAIPSKNGGAVTVSLENATKQYLRVLRNTSHGFGGKDDAGRRRDEVLLMSHTGELPHDFALLPYLYWLDCIANPQRLRTRLTGRQ